MLARTLPELAGSSEPGGADTSNRKTFSFGPLKPGETTRAVWKLSAVSGPVHAPLPVGAGLSGDAKARPPAASPPAAPSSPQISTRAARTPKSPTAAKSSKRTEASDGGPPAGRSRSRLVLGLPACGAASQPDRGGADARAGGGVALKKVGEFDAAGLRHRGAGLPEAAVRGRAAGHGSRCCAAAAGCPHPFLDIGGQVGFDGGERGLLSIAFPPDYRRSGRFYVYYNDNAGNIRVDEFRRRSPTRAARRLPAPGDRDPAPGQRQPQRRPAAVPRQRPLLRHRRRRLRRRPAQQRPEQGRAARQAAADRPAPGGRPALLGPALQPVRRPPRPRRDLQLRPAQPVPLLLRQASASSRGSRSATSARTASRSSTTRPSRRRAGPTSAGTRSRASPPTATKTAAPATPAARPSRSSPTATAAAAAAARSSAATWSATARLRSLHGRYVYADLCEGQLRSLVPHLKRASGDRKLGLAVDTPTSFGEDDAHQLYVASLDGPVYRLAPR